MIRIFIILLLLVSSCSNPDAGKTIKKATKLISSGKRKAGCNEIYRLSPRHIASWPEITSLSYLRILSMCRYQLGHDSVQDISKLSEPWKSYYQALIYFKAGIDIDKSVKILNKLIIKNGSNPEFIYRLGLLLMLDEQYEKACPLLEQAYNKTPEINYTISLARCWLGWGKINKLHPLLSGILKEGVTHDQIKAGTKILETARSYKQIINKEIMTALKNTRSSLKAGNSGKALDFLEQTAKKYPGYAVIHYLMAVIHLRLGNRSGSVVELDRALKIDPTDPDVHYLLGFLFRQTMQYSRALAHLNMSVKFNPFNIKAHAMIKEIYTIAENYRAASEIQRRIIILNGEKGIADLLTELGQYEEKSGDLDSSLETHLKVLKKQGDDAGYMSLISIARIYIKLSMKYPEKSIVYRKKARKYADRAYAVRPVDPEVNAIRKELGIEKDSKSDFEKKMKISGATRVEEN
ncbi:tetratricopeptide repeat protein [Myxococcota bacterium]|nr:tetratricopeptide repeat protein [Myxococcota bacterium]